MRFLLTSTRQNDSVICAHGNDWELLASSSAAKARFGCEQDFFCRKSFHRSYALSEHYKGSFMAGYFCCNTLVSSKSQGRIPVLPRKARSQRKSSGNHNSQMAWAQAFFSFTPSSVLSCLQVLFTFSRICKVYFKSGGRNETAALWHCGPLQVFAKWVNVPMPKKSHPKYSQWKFPHHAGWVVAAGYKPATIWIAQYFTELNNCWRIFQPFCLCIICMHQAIYCASLYALNTVSTLHNLLFSAKIVKHEYSDRLENS